MDKEQKRLAIWLLAWSVACPVIATMMAMAVGGTLMSIILYIGGHLLLLLSFAVLSFSVWGAVVTGMLSRMEAWWWLSTPYSIAFPLVLMAFGLNGMFVAHILTLFGLGWWVTVSSSAAWALVAVFRVSVYPREEFTATKKLMLALATLMFLFFLGAALLERSKNSIIPGT